MSCIWRCVYTQALGALRAWTRLLHILGSSGGMTPTQHHLTQQHEATGSTDTSSISTSLLVLIVPSIIRTRAGTCKRIIRVVRIIRAIRAIRAIRQGYDGVLKIDR